MNGGHVGRGKNRGGSMGLSIAASSGRPGPLRGPERVRITQRYLGTPPPEWSILRSTASIAPQAGW